MHLSRLAPLALVSAALMLVSCGTHDYPGYKHAPYTVRGERHHPMHPTAAVGHTERGIASWYDERRFFSRGKTALGEPFRPHAMAGAHKTVPLPARVRVTNLENGRQVVVRLNDRGPFVRGRVIDVTPAAARKLGFKDKGLARVEIEVLSVGDGKWRRTR